MHKNYSICIFYYYLTYLTLNYIIVTISFLLIKNITRQLLPKVYIKHNDIMPDLSYSGKIKVSVRKVTSTFGLSSGVAKPISEHFGKKWKSV